MKNKFDLILNISVFVLGVIFIVLWSNGKGVFDLVSMAVGILFIVFSVWSLVALLVKRKDGVLPTKAVAWTSVPVVGSLALGIAMVAASSFFVEIFSYLFATMLIVGAIYKFWRIMSAKKTVDYPVWVFIIPSVVMVCGIVLFAVGIQIVQQWLALIVGIAFIVYSLHSLLESVLFERLRSKRTKQNVEDVDFVDIPDNDSH